MFHLAHFRGGIHPAAHKDRSAALGIAVQPLPPRLYLPLRQHAGAEALPVVKAGERVLKGQLLAGSPTELSAPIHAPSSGRIVSIGPIDAPHPSGLQVNGMVLECDGEERWIELDVPADPFAEAPQRLAQRVADAGVVGLGGAIFPAAVKLKQGTKHEIKTVLVNGSECEPYLSCDDRLMRERAEAVVDGARLIQHILRAYSIVIAIEDNKPAALAAMRAASEPYGAVEVVAVPALYPMGSAKQLIRQVTGREVPAGGRSTDVGVLVHNAGTVYAIQQALRHGRPLISRVVTVAGGCVSSPRNVETLIGTPAQALLDTCGGLLREPRQLLLGGPMMGMPLPSTAVPVIKGATGLLALDRHELPHDDSAPCIRCARCVDACPMGLAPLEMAARTRVDDFDGASEYGLRDCILCGCCAYVCPSHIPLVQYFQYAVGQQDERRSAARKNDYIKRLTEAREARLAEEEAARAAAKAAKKRKTAAPAASSEVSS
ncbi:electron transport complex subunit RsxC [Pseudomonas stutzeri]|jgi:electron transport complex protein RnfC|uniref:Ion-translocating oxidoreductase complex subunit C n=1 Tax=Stutzerimonas stutzeri NF13 TaxID=1212548 RepID=M2VGV2_STUST|nr:electron transport complex subunit RsxC [Stutzerimonas stutzeri]EMD98893.1 RnfABCDGE type electron transport complex subunit C [Stutzerimonas stutzeri NF13]MBK3880527.1 electron transport complex subunit RsxC [Stutzerimonas stutzeri]MCQ4291933.1 electron transport complex subunit RsxC [Stutzerimonas stutzeri]WOF80061.1 electron transport complex subunit RsxC [Pseudomonas sp. FeN3W]